MDEVTVSIRLANEFLYSMMLFRTVTFSSLLFFKSLVVALISSDSYKLSLNWF